MSGPNLQRERDVRDWIVRTLTATNAFEGIYSGAFASEDGQSSGQNRAVGIEPIDSTVTDPWSGGGFDDVVECRVKLTFYSRARDGLDCDDAAERMYAVAYNAVVGTDLGGLAMPAYSRFTRTAWQKPKDSERRLEATLQYRYLVDESMNVDL